MPKLGVWLTRASLLYMGIGFLFGALILTQKGILVMPWAWRLLNPHIELMIFGWTMQFVMGIAAWILPRFSGKDRYGNTLLGWWGFGLLNAGILLTLAGAWSPYSLLIFIGRLCTLGAVVLFVIYIWPRVKPVNISTTMHSKGTTS